MTSVAPNQDTAQHSDTSQVDFLRAITDNLGEGTCALDTSGRVTFMNRMAERLLGWTETELRGKDLHETIHFQHADGTPFPKEQCPVLRVMRSGHGDRVDDDVFTRRDGSLCPVAYFASPLMRGGVVSGAVLAFHDISAQKALDEALRRSEREAAARASQLQAAFESMADAVVVFDSTGHVLETNATNIELFAPTTVQPGADIRSVNQPDYLSTFRDPSGQLFTPELWPPMRVLQGEVLRGAGAVDLTIRAVDGRETVVNASGAPVRDAEGNIIGGVLIGRDVTERRRLEQQTREALTALMAIAEALVADVTIATEQMPSGILNISHRLAELARAVMACQRVSIVSIEPASGELHAEAVAGLTSEQEQALRAHWPQSGRHDDYLPPTVIERLNAGETIAIDRTQPPFNCWMDPFGSRALLVAPMRVSGRHLGDLVLDYGNVAHQPTPEELAMAGTISKLAAQIIERERLARDREIARAEALALVEATRRMDEFLSIAAHELKTPVANSQLTVTLATDTVKRVMAQAAATQDVQGEALATVAALLERTESHIDRLSRLVVDLVDVSRIRGGKLELRLAPCNLADLVRDVVEEQRQMTPGRVIRMRLPAATGPQPRPIAHADVDRIRQVVTNYLSNALKYSREDQPVHVHLRTEGEWARVSVRDQGPGVPAAQQRHVWERFYRVQGTQVLTGVGVGLGLGLYISRTIIEQHHGRVGLHNAPGGGTIFWFALPLLADEAT